MSDKLAELKTFVVMWASYYRETLSDMVVTMYARDLLGCEIAHLNQAMNEIKQDRNIKRFPMPAELKHRLKPVLSDDQVAREVVGRIVMAVAKFGSYRAQEARTFIGEIGWEVVKRQGSWETLCADMPPPASAANFHAQLRELAKSIMDQSRAGSLDLAPALPGAKALELAQSVTKLLPGGEK